VAIRLPLSRKESMRQHACYLTALQWAGYLRKIGRQQEGHLFLRANCLQRHEAIGAILVEKLTTRSTSDWAVSSRNENRLTSSIQCRQHAPCSISRSPDPSI
jgi:hypothetical protein